MVSTLKHAKVDKRRNGKKKYHTVLLQMKDIILRDCVHYELRHAKIMKRTFMRSFTTPANALAIVSPTWFSPTLVCDHGARLVFLKLRFSNAGAIGSIHVALLAGCAWRSERNVVI